MFCDYFLYLFYIGCYELRIDLLRTNLGFLFMVDEIRRILLESVIPYLSQKSAKSKLKKEGKLKLEKDGAAYIEQKEMEEIELGDYETFDDYLEMIITFGYVTLFACKMKILILFL
jgi:anoctamin-10